jgi:L-amino acid N-acyltransferase YncA
VIFFQDVIAVLFSILGFFRVKLNLEKLKKIIKGKNFNLVRFKTGDKKLYELAHSIFYDEKHKGFISSEYLGFKSKSVVKKWIDKNAKNKCEGWYTIKIKEKYIGFVYYKSRINFCEACELSIALMEGYRNFETGYQTVRTFIDYLVNEKLFKYIVAYSDKKNKLAEKLVKKLGFKKTNKLHKEITKRFYNGKSSLNIILNYNLFLISIK